MARKSKSKARQGEGLSAPLLSSDSSSSVPALTENEAFNAANGVSSEATGSASLANTGYANTSAAPGYQAGGGPPAGASRYPVGIPPLIASPGFAYGTPGAGYPASAGTRTDPNYSYYYPGTSDGKPILKQQPMDPRTQIETGAWATGLFSCFESCVPNFFMAFVCPCVSLAQIYARIGFWSFYSALVQLGALYLVGYVGYLTLAFSPQSTEYSDLDDKYKTTRVVPVAVSAALMLGHLAFLLSIKDVRKKVRDYFEIPGSVKDDVVTSFFCPCCAIAQMATHVKSYTPQSCSLGSPDELPRYPV